MTRKFVKRSIFFFFIFIIIYFVYRNLYYYDIGLYSHAAERSMTIFLLEILSCNSIISIGSNILICMVQV